MKDFYIKKKKRKFEVIINNKSNGIYSSYNQIKTAKKVANNLIGIKKNIIFHLKEKKEFGKIYGPYIGYIKDGNIKVKLYKMKGGFIGKLYNQIAPSIRKKSKKEENLIELRELEEPVKIISINNLNKEEANKLVKSSKEAFKKAEQNAKLATEKYNKSKIISNAEEQVAANANRAAQQAVANANRAAQQAVANANAALQAVKKAEENAKLKSNENTQVKIKELRNANAALQAVKKAEENAKLKSNENTQVKIKELRNANIAVYQQAIENSNRAAILEFESEEKAAENANRAAQQAAENAISTSKIVKNAEEKERLIANANKKVQAKSNAVAKEQVTANIAQNLLNSRKKEENNAAQVVASETNAQVEAKNLKKKSNLVTNFVDNVPESLNVEQKNITSTSTRDTQVIQPFINYKMRNPQIINQKIIPYNFLQYPQQLINNTIPFISFINQTSILPRSENPITL
jgi:hypothetical protein